MLKNRALRAPSSLPFHRLGPLEVRYRPDLCAKHVRRYGQAGQAIFRPRVDEPARNVERRDRRLCRPVRVWNSYAEFIDPGILKFLGPSVIIIVLALRDY